MDSLNYHCAWRLNLAKQVFQKIKHIDVENSIKAIIVAGSVARGYADEYSDLEIPIFWAELPDENMRKRLINELNGKYFNSYNHESGEDNIAVNGFKVDLWHITVKQEDEVIKSVIDDFDVDYGKSNALDTIRTCIPLYGEEIVKSWQDRVKNYPKQIAIKNIFNILQLIDNTQVDLYLHRNNSTLVFEYIINLQKNIFIILLALNSEYFPTFKWMYKALETFKFKPENIEQRFREVYSCSPAQAVESTLAILNETFDIIKKFYPKINTNLILNKLASTRMSFVNPIEFK